MDYYEWFDPHAVRDWLKQADDRLYYESRDYRAQHESDQKQIAYLRGRLEGMMDYASKQYAMMPLTPIFVTKNQ